MTEIDAAVEPEAEIVLLRHGATEWSAAGKHTGRTDIPLTSEGEQQAKTAAAKLAGFHFGLALTSPLSRASRTAELAGLTDVQVEPDLQEWDYGGYEGLTTEEIREQKPGWLLWRDGIIDGPRGNGETAADVGTRADRVISRVISVLEPTSGQGRDVVVVSHGHMLRVFAARWLGLAAAAGAYFALDTASISVLGFEHGERVIRLWNETPDER
ncbi:MAG: histidine phosphatase family protein [Acidothermaceae bacterium]